MSPWKPEQMQKKNKKLTPKEAEQAAAVANQVLESERDGQKASPENEGKAIRMANSVAKKGRKNDKVRASERERPGVRRMMGG